MPQTFLAYSIILGFEKRCPKQNTVARLQSNILSPSEDKLLMRNITDPTKELQNEIDFHRQRNKIYGLRFETSDKIDAKITNKITFNKLKDHTEDFIYNLLSFLLTNPPTTRQEGEQAVISTDPLHPHKCNIIKPLTQLVMDWLLSLSSKES